MNRRVRILIAGLVMTASVVVLVATTVRATWYAPETEIAPPAGLVLHESPQKLRPVQVTVPTIGVDTGIEQLGLTAGNRIAAPSTFSQIGWYKYGPAPGQKGTAILYGHLDNGLGLDGVLINLKNVQAGDEVIVTNNEGKKLRFVVDDIQTYSYKNVPDTALSQTRDEAAHIVLITCAGKWIDDPEEGWTYDHRLMVYATLQSVW